MTATIHPLPVIPHDDTPPDPVGRVRDLIVCCGTAAAQDTLGLDWVREQASSDPFFAEMLYAYESPVEAFLAAAGSAAILEASR